MVGVHWWLVLPVHTRVWKSSYGSFRLVWNCIRVHIQIPYILFYGILNCIHFLYSSFDHEPLKLQLGNPFLDQNMSVTSHKPTTGTPMLCAAKYQHHPDFFRLPAASPFDNFLKAAGSWSHIGGQGIVTKFPPVTGLSFVVYSTGSQTPGTGCFQKFALLVAFVVGRNLSIFSSWEVKNCMHFSHKMPPLMLHISLVLGRWRWRGICFTLVPPQCFLVNMTCPTIQSPIL